MFNAFLSFDSFIFPKLVKYVYWLGLGLTALFTVVGIVTALFTGNFLGILFAIIGGAVGVVVWRVTVELWMVLFSIYDVLKEIRDQRRGA
ncbi:MAG TPA: DUF4282 domain-containing protein [Devosiaceae bacterium]|jgi:uncharacterized membrane protein